MLREQSKQRFQLATEAAIKRFGIEPVFKYGPVALVARIIDSGRAAGFIEEANHVEENRAEAESFVAGLLGMM